MRKLLKFTAIALALISTFCISAAAGYTANIAPISLAKNADTIKNDIQTTLTDAVKMTDNYVDVTICAAKLDAKYTNVISNLQVKITASADIEALEANEKELMTVIRDMINITRLNISPVRLDAYEKELYQYFKKINILKRKYNFIADMYNRKIATKKKSYPVMKTFEIIR